MGENKRQDEWREGEKRPSVVHLKAAGAVELDSSDLLKPFCWILLCSFVTFTYSCIQLGLIYMTRSL